MTDNNYTQILKQVHDNPEEYIGQIVKLDGYIFRANDFDDDEFVIAKDMLINDTEYRIVGFLCKYADAKSFKDKTCVEAEGIITLGDYHGPMPIIKITKIKNEEEP